MLQRLNNYRREPVETTRPFASKLYLTAELTVFDEKTEKIFFKVFLRNSHIKN